MIPRRARLPLREFFVRKALHVFLRGSFVSLRAKANNEKRNRYAVVIGKSVEKLATQRNKWKRYMRAPLSSFRDRGIDVLLSLDKKPPEGNTTRVREEIQNLFTEAEKKIT